MPSEEIQQSINELTKEKGVLKVCLYDRQGKFIAEDSSQDFAKQGKEYGQLQIKKILSLTQNNNLSLDEIVYDLDETRVYIKFFDSATLMLICYSEAKMSSLKFAVNDLCTKVQRFLSSQSKHLHKRALHSRTQSFNKNQIPDIIETDPDFIIYLKKQLNKYNAPQATREISKYINKHKLNIDRLDAQNAYNLIISLSKHVPEDFREGFSLKTQEVIKQYF